MNPKTRIAGVIGSLILLLGLISCGRKSADSVKPSEDAVTETKNATAAESKTENSAKKENAAKESKTSAETGKTTEKTAKKNTFPEITNPGIKNFFKVDDGLYRGAQPEDEDFEAMWKMGLRSVVNFRNFHSDEDETEHTGLIRYHFPTNAGSMGDKQIIAFLKVATDPKNRPMYVHCWHGSDRTGTAIAMYRIVVQGWTKEAAIKEMLKPQFGFHSFFYQNLLDYIRNADIEKIRREAGIR